MISKRLPKSDVMGALASGLCVVHCMATPFLFLVQSSSLSACCAGGPFWWSMIDYLFIIITFFAAYQTGKHTSKPWLKYAIYVSWSLLSLLVVNEKFAFIPLEDYWKYTAAFGLISLHLYNLRFCQCTDN